MNELQIFEKAEFGKVRIVMCNGEPWFVARDVAEALGYTWSGSRFSHVPEEWKGMTSVVTPRRRTGNAHHFRARSVLFPCQIG